jgi:hypothetical protein
MPDLIYGPQTATILALIERAHTLTPDELTALAAAWDVVARDAAWNARDAAWDAARMNASRHAWDAVIAARHAARHAAMTTVRDAAGDVALAAGDAALALAVRDLIPRTAYDALTGPWARTIGPVHPDERTSPMPADDPLLDPAAEATLMGVSRATVSRVRKDPAHPANGDDAEIVSVGTDTYIRAPQSAIIVWWPPRNSGLSVAQWRALRALVHGDENAADLFTPRIRARLRTKGLIADGAATDTGQRLVTDHERGRSPLTPALAPGGDEPPVIASINVAVDDDTITVVAEAHATHAGTAVTATGATTCVLEEGMYVTLVVEAATATATARALDALHAAAAVGTQQEQD